MFVVKIPALQSLSHWQRKRAITHMTSHALNAVLILHIVQTVFSFWSYRYLQDVRRYHGILRSFLISWFLCLTVLSSFWRDLYGSAFLNNVVFHIFLSSSCLSFFLYMAVALFYRHFGRASFHTVIRRTLTAEDQLRSRVGYVMEKFALRPFFSSSASDFLCHYHSASASYSVPFTYNLSNWQHR